MSTVTKPIALDETLQSTNTTLGSLGKDTTLQAIATAIANVGLSNIGNLSSLATTDKTSLVSAINEVVGDVSDLDTDKADKVASATNGNLAGLNASGNLADSGVSASEIPALWKSQGEYGVKNLIPYPYYDGASKTHNGITYTVNADGSVTAVGTATSTSVFQLIAQNATIDLPVGDYVLTGDLDEGTSYTPTAILFNEDTYQGTPHWNYGKNRPAYFTISEEGYKVSSLRLRVQNGSTVNQTFYPMIRIASDTDATYRPYAKTNKQLTDEVSENAEDIDAIETKIDTTTTSASGNPISITDLKSNQLAVNPVITFEPIQAGSGDPSPSNVRAISGYDKIEVLSCGVNTITGYQKGGIENDGTENTNTNSCRTDFIKVIPNSSYYFIKDTNLDGSAYYIYYDSYKNFISYNSNLGTGVINIPNNVGYVRFQFYLSGSGWGTNLPNRKDGFNYPATQTSYVESNKTTDLSENLPQTVYGGTLDVENGVLVVDRGIIDLSSIDWEYRLPSGFNWYRFDSPVLSELLGANQNYGLCSNYKYVNSPNANQPDHTITFYSGTGKILVHESNCTDATAFKAIMSGQKFCYELATPITINLTPHEISLLKDYAYVSTNGTSMSFDYHNGELASLADVASVNRTIEGISENVVFEDVSQYFVKDDTNINSANVSAYRIGKMVFISGSFVPNALTSMQNKLLFNITNDKILPLSANIPVTGTYIPIVSQSGTAWTIVLSINKLNKRIKTDNNGAYGAISNITTNSLIAFSAAYVCQG